MSAAPPVPGHLDALDLPTSGIDDKPLTPAAVSRERRAQNARRRSCRAILATCTGTVAATEYDAKLGALVTGLSGEPTSDAVQAAATELSAEEALVRCEGCGEKFLPHLRPKHQRAPLRWPRRPT